MCLTTASCTDRRKVKSLMMDFIKSEIVIPNDLELIHKGRISNLEVSSLKPSKFIIYYDSLDCSECRVAHLIDLHPLYSLADTSSFSIITIFSPKYDEVDKVRRELILSHNLWPVYIDINGNFRDNNNIPQDHRFHYFAINADNQPVFVGNPLANDKIYRVFLDVIKTKFN